MIKIRQAAPADAEVLQELYFNHLTKYPPVEPQDMEVWRNKIARFAENPLYYLLGLK